MFYNAELFAHCDATMRDKLHVLLDHVGGNEDRDKIEMHVSPTTGLEQLSSVFEGSSVVFSLPILERVLLDRDDCVVDVLKVAPWWKKHVTVTLVQGANNDEWYWKKGIHCGGLGDIPEGAAAAVAAAGLSAEVAVAGPEVSNTIKVHVNQIFHTRRTREVSISATETVLALKSRLFQVRNGYFFIHHVGSLYGASSKDAFFVI